MTESMGGGGIRGVRRWTLGVTDITEHYTPSSVTLKVPPITSDVVRRALPPPRHIRRSSSFLFPSLGHICCC
jgi:hypothetical protein